MDGRNQGKEAEEVSLTGDDYWKKVEGSSASELSGNWRSITHKLGWELIQTQRDPDSMENTIVSPISAMILLELAAGAADSLREAERSQMIEGFFPVPIEGRLASLVHTLKTSTIDDASTQHNACFDSKEDTLYDYLERVVGTKMDGNRPDSAKAEANWIAECMRDSTSKTSSVADLRQTYLGLTNSLVLKSNWNHSFLADPTALEYGLTISPQQPHQVEMMSAYRVSVETSYGESYIAVRLPYTCTSPSLSHEAAGHTGLGMVAYLPDPSVSVQETIAEIQRSSDAQRFRPKVYEHFGFPKFTIEASTELEQLLRERGYLVQGAYSCIGKIGRTMDYSAQIANGHHCRKVGKRSERTANTASVLGARGRSGTRMLRTRPTLVFDRPFAFSIQSEDSQTVLFTGVFMGS